MCGVTGIFSPTGSTRETLSAQCRAMTDTLAHRGPDDSGVFVDAAAGLALGHRRLSILELSPLGHQPMRSASARYTLCYNGEIYNHLELRTKLTPLGHRFRGGSDTETMLAAIEEWGLPGAVERFVGMFAFALWDAREHALHLVRDRLGVKPLFYGYTGDSLVFGSELNALRAHPGFAPEINRDALALYFRYGYIPAPHSIYRNAHKLQPGRILTFRGPGLEPVTTVYWDVLDIWLRDPENIFSGDMVEAADELEKLLSLSIRRRMLSDVPLGAFLSGGIDSSTVVALMQSQSHRPVKTFCIGFSEADFDESAYARRVAAHLGTDHTELCLDARQVLGEIPSATQLWDEPFADVSQVPTLLLSRLARGQVTVSLSGDGGDELFSGYQRYFSATATRWPLAPPFLRPLAGWLANKLPVSSRPVLGSLPWKLQWRMELLATSSLSERYKFLVSASRRPATLVPGATEPRASMLMVDPGQADSFQAMAAMDLAQYLPDNILTKLDRASMAVGLEARVPLLDHHVVEFAASLPTALKIQNGTGKQVLRRILHRHVPPSLVERPKMGFGIPVGQWLRGELRDWCATMLSPARIRSQGLLDAREVTRLWDEHAQGKANRSHEIWALVIFQSWLETHLT